MAFAFQQNKEFLSAIQTQNGRLLQKRKNASRKQKRKN